MIELAPKTFMPIQTPDLHRVKHLKRNTYTDIYKQEQNLSCETPTTILILISFCPLENKLYITTFCVLRKKVDKICTTLFLTHTGEFCRNLTTIYFFV